MYLQLMINDKQYNECKGKARQALMFYFDNLFCPEKRCSVVHLIRFISPSLPVFVLLNTTRR